jgi:hypothetical protein
VKYLRIFLWLVAIHSFCVGLGLMLIPLEYYDFFGFGNYQGSFFKIQAGIFHMVLVIAYVFAARDPVKYRVLILFSILAKFIATLFLIGYSFFAEMVWMVLVSGIADFLMGLILLAFYLKFKPLEQQG